MKWHPENKTGFTLIEAVLAVAIVAVVMTAIFVAQGTALYAINRVSNELRRLYAASDYLLTKRKENVNNVETKEDQKILTSPATTLSYTCQKAQSPSLAKFKDIYVEQVSFAWKEQRTPRTGTIVGLSFKPPRPES